MERGLALSRDLERWARAGSEDLELDGPLVDVTVEVYGPHSDLAATLQLTSEIHAGLDNESEAETLVREALAMMTEARGEDALETLYCVGNFADFLRDQENLEEADSLYQRAVSGLEDLSQEKGITIGHLKTAPRASAASFSLPKAKGF